MALLPILKCCKFSYATVTTLPGLGYALPSHHGWWAPPPCWQESDVPNFGYGYFRFRKNS